MIRVFVAAAYSWHPKVRELHERLRTIGFGITSTWAELAVDGRPEGLEVYTAEERHAMWLANRDGIRSADILVMLADSPAREGFAEAEYARIIGKAIIWVGRDTLSSTVDALFVRVVDEDAAIATAVNLRHEFRVVDAEVA